MPLTVPRLWTFPITGKKHDGVFVKRSWATFGMNFVCHYVGQVEWVHKLSVECPFLSVCRYVGQVECVHRLSVVYPFLCCGPLPEQDSRCSSHHGRWCRHRVCAGRRGTRLHPTGCLPHLATSSHHIPHLSNPVLNIYLCVFLSVLLTGYPASWTFSDCN